MYPVLQVIEDWFSGSGFEPDSVEVELLLPDGKMKPWVKKAVVSSHRVPDT